METITIKVDDELAKAYREVTPIKRQEIENILTDLLKKMIQKRNLDEIINDLQQQAIADNLAQEILDDEIKPLKGKVISYENPFDPVVNEADWDVLA